MGVDQRSQGLGQGEGDQVVVDREEFGALAFQPEFAGRVLALGAEAMTARQGEDLVGLAVVTVDGGGAAGLSAAVADRRQGLALPG